MEWILATTSGVLLAAGFYSLLKRNLLQILIGILVLGHGASLVVFLSGGLKPGQPAFVPEGATVLGANQADPLPQALVLTAIVIGFGITGFVLMLFKQSWNVVGTLSTEAYRSSGSEGGNA